VNVLDRFEEALKNESRDEQLTGDFVKASMELAKEIAVRGARGGQITEVEKQFIKSSTLLMLQSLVRR
jgi:hypothetical protein